MVDVEKHMDPYRHYLPDRTSEFIKVVRSPWFFLVYVPLFNFLLFVTIGRYILCAILFPYQNSIVREQLDRGNSAKFGEEFAHLLDSLVYTLRIQADDNEMKEEMLASLKNMSKNERRKSSRIFEFGNEKGV